MKSLDAMHSVIGCAWAVRWGKKHKVVVMARGKIDG